MTDDPLDPDDEELLRQVRLLRRRKSAPAKLPDDQTLWAYVSGTSSAAQTSEVHAALAEDAELRAGLLELMSAQQRESTEEEKRAFLQAEVPPIEHDPRLAELYASYEPVSPHVRARKPPPKERWRMWLMPAYASALTVACAALGIMLYQERRGAPQVPSGVPGWGTTTTFSLEIVRSTPLSGTVRGDAEAMPPEPERIRVHGDGRAVQVNPPQLVMTDDSQVHVRVIAPGDKSIVDERRPVAELSAQPTITIRSSDPLPLGHYELIFSGVNEGKPIEVVSRFVLER